MHPSRPPRGSAVAAAGSPIVMVSNLANGLCADGDLNDTMTVLEEPCLHYSGQLWTISLDGGALTLKNYHYDGCLDLVSPAGSGPVRHYNAAWQRCLQGGRDQLWRVDS